MRQWTSIASSGSGPRSVARAPKPASSTSRDSDSLIGGSFRGAGEQPAPSEQLEQRRRRGADRLQVVLFQGPHRRQQQGYPLGQRHPLKSALARADVGG